MILAMMFVQMGITETMKLTNENHAILHALNDLDHHLKNAHNVTVQLYIVYQGILNVP